MRPRILLTGLLAGAALLLAAVCPTSAGTPDIMSHWTNKPIAIDGNIDDWNGLPTTLLSDQGPVVGLANDSENLYVQIRFHEAIWPRVIHRTGLTLYLDAKGGKSKDVGIKLVGGPSMEELRKSSPQGEQSGDESGYRHSRPGMNGDRMRGRDDTVFTYFNKKGLINATIGLEGANGPKAAWGIDHGFYVYEFSIPLTKDKVRDYGIGLEPGKKLGFGAEWGGRPEGMGQGGNGHPHFSGTGFPGEGGEGGEGGGMMGGGDGDEGGGGWHRGGGRRGGGPGGEQMRKAFTKQDFWTKTKLAVGSAKSN